MLFRSPHFRALLVKQKKSEIKNALSALLASIYAPLANASLTSVNENGRASARTQFEVIEINWKKDKGHHLLPFAVASLCATSAATFHEKFPSFLEAVLQPPKDPAVRISQLEALFTLVYSSFTKFDVKNEGGRQKIRGAVASQLLANCKKPPYPMELEHIDVIVDIIQLLAVFDVESTVASIVVPILQLTSSPETLVVGMV